MNARTIKANLSGGRSGQAMVISLIAIGVLTAVLGAAALVTSVFSRLSYHEHERLAAHYLGRSGIEIALARLKEEDGAALLTPPAALHPDGEADARWNLPTGEYGLGFHPSGTETALPWIVDEESKININAASPAMLRALIPDLEEDVLEAIAARRRDRPFASVHEFLQFAGVEVPPPTPGDGDHPVNHAGGILTVHGIGRLNVNTAPARALQCIEGLTEQHVQALIARRPMADLDDVRVFLDLDVETWRRIEPWIGTQSSHFTVRSWGRSGLSPMRSAPVASIRAVVQTGDGTLRIVEWEEENAPGM